MTRDRTVDEVTYSLQVGRVWDLRRRLGESRTIMLYRIYQELTPEQHKKLHALRERYRGGRGGGSR
jgi:Spy/CpxP family protein refolding chaperone